ncbi:hypothetical protein Q2T40_03085 [Winogradskyella maritima]|nr:hypothetical protein [Winogradskyella maritima]
MRALLTLFLLISTTAIFAQDEEPELQPLKAVVVNAQTEKAMESVHVVNLTQVIGTITDQNGEFTVSAAVDDIIYFSFLGFKISEN